MQGLVCRRVPIFLRRSVVPASKLVVSSGGRSEPFGALARRFDEALRPCGLTSGQYSMMMSLNQPEPPSMGSIASLLSVDRTTLTTALKPLQRRGLVAVTVDANDRRSRRLKLTPAGRALLASAVPVWRRTHAKIESLVPRAGADRLRRDLRALT
jgi:DNA-binding MarR family transcriptional regulator